MKSTKFFGFILSVAAMTFVIPTSVDAVPVPQDTPDAKTVIEKHIKALGGRSKLESVKTASYEGGMVMVAGPGEMEGEMEIIQHKNKFLMVTNISSPMGDMEIKQGSDGDVFWMSQAGQFQVLDDDQSGSAKDMYGQVFPALGWNKYDGEIKNTGIKKVDGKDCYTLVFNPKKGSKATRYFDTTTGYMVKVVTSQKSMMGVIDVTNLHSDFKTIDGIVVSHKQVTDMGQMQMEMEIEKVKFNQEIDAKKFVLPDEVKEMDMKKKEKEKEKKKEKMEADK